MEIAAVNAQLNANESLSGILQAAHKAKVKWLNLVHSSTPSKESNGSPSPSSAQTFITRSKSLTRRTSVKKNQRPATLAGSKVQVVEANESLSTRHVVTSSVSVPAGEPVSAPLTGEDTPRKSTSSFSTEFVKGSGEIITKIAKNGSRGSVTRKGRSKRDGQTTEEVLKGIYDSSSKQRVPSWCVSAPTIRADCHLILPPGVIVYCISRQSSRRLTPSRNPPLQYYKSRRRDCYGVANESVNSSPMLSRLGVDESPSPQSPPPPQTPIVPRQVVARPSISSDGAVGLEVDKNRCPQYRSP